MNMSSKEGVKVLSMWASPFGMTVLMALKEKGVEYDYVEEDLSNKSPLLLSSNPLHKMVPVLLHDGRPICESLIILQYINDTWPSTTSLLPSDPYQRAHARFWADFINKKFYEVGKLAFRNPDAATREQAKDELQEIFAILDKELSQLVTPFFGGQSIGLIELAFAPYAYYFKNFDKYAIMQLPAPQKCPHFTEWKNRLLEYPSVKEILDTIPQDKMAAAMNVKV